MATLTGDQFILSKQDNITLEIEGLPEVSFFVTNFSIPGISTGLTPIPNPFLEHNAPGTKLTYEAFDIQMLLAEKLQNWIAIRDWILEGNNGVTYDTGGITRRLGTITVTTNNGNPIFTISIKNMFPISLAPVDVDIQQAEPVPPTVSVNFSFESFDVQVVT